MKISYKLRIPRSCLQLAEVALTVLSLCGSIAQYCTAQDSSPPTPASSPLPAKPTVAPSNEPTKTLEPPLPRTYEPGQQEQGPTRPLPFENSPPKADINPSTYPDPAQAASSRSDSKRLQILEKQILELTSELQALRAQSGSGFNIMMAPPMAPASERRSPTVKQPETAQNPPTPYREQMKTAADQSARKAKVAVAFDEIKLLPQGEERVSITRNPLPGDPDVQSVTITRSTYKLPPGRAEALAKLLAELLDDEIDIKVKGDALQVTAAARDQQAIERVIALFLRRGREPKPAPAPLAPLSSDQS